jgi:hypothetical protein
MLIHVSTYMLILICYNIFQTTPYETPLTHLELKMIDATMIYPSTIEIGQDWY